MPSPNYPGAIWYPTTWPQLDIDSGTGTGDYSISNRGADQINYVVIHTTEGNRAYDAVDRWANYADAGAHYVIDGTTIYQVVADKDIAYHATNNQYNRQSIGIEIVGFAGTQSTISDAEFRAAADLTRWLCSTYTIPIYHDPLNDRHSDAYMLQPGIVGHSQVYAADLVSYTKTDPGFSNARWNEFISLVAGGSSNTAPSVTILAASSYAAGTVLTGTQLFSASDAQGASDINHITIYDANETNGAVWKYNSAVIHPGSGGYQIAYANRGLLTYTVGTGGNDSQIQAFDNAGLPSNAPVMSITGTATNTAPSVTILAASSYAAGTVLTGTQLFSASDA
ncbi:MAG: peptidoglycan recognition family protein, partial [Planctomycetota bacterium]